MAYQPQFTNINVMVQQSVAKFAHRPLFGTRQADGWHWTTYAEFGALIDRARAAFTKLGVKAGDRVAVISNNRLEWVVGAHGAYSMGAIYVPMYEAQLDKEWQFILSNCGAKVCLAATTDIKRRVQDLQESLPDLEHIVCFGDGEFQGLLDDAKHTPVAPTEVGDDEVATLIYTSGTTGNPKGVMLTHRNMASNVSALLDISPLVGDERALSFLPWAHVFGGTVELNSIIAFGSSTGICSDTTKLLDYLPEVQPTHMFAVPRIWNRIYDGVQKQIAAKPAAIQWIFHTAMAAKTAQKQGGKLRKRDRVAMALADKLIFSKIVDKFGGKLKFAFSGAAALSKDVAQFIDNLGIQVYEGYGMTESTGGTTGNRPDAVRIGSVGQAFPGVEIRIDENAPGGGNGEGEILIYGTGVMRGYWGNEEATREALTEDGGIRTGDLGRLDADGFLYITGRVKELYKLENGKYVAPAPLEERLQLSPYISQCMLWGDNKPHNVAVVIPDMPTLRSWAQSQGIAGDDAAILADARTRQLIKDELNQHSREFKGFETVRDFVLDAEEMSPDNGMLTPTLKVKRREVMAKYGEQLQALYT